MLDLERAAASKTQKTDMEMHKEEHEKAIRKMAAQALDENNDLVKMMNTLASRAAAFTIRDQQVAEKKEREAREQEYEKRMDMLMEIDRLRDLQRRETEDQERLRKRIDDRSVIIDQIRMREKAKLLNEESREQENQAMLTLISKYQEEDELAQRQHAEQVVRSRAEVVAANAAAITKKELAKQREKDEDEAIILYNAQKDAALRRREEEEGARILAMKERQAALLAQQEKSQNKQAEIDELRARRYAEERERRERDRELKDARDKQAMTMELQNARTLQAAHRKAMMAREAVMQQDEYEGALEYALSTMKREQDDAQKKQAIAHEFREGLQKQIELKGSSKGRSTQEKYEEGRALKREFAAERAKLEAVREKMVLDMERKGINPRYLTEMKSADIAKAQMG